MRLPPLNALRAFEAAARLGSFLEASRELNVTPAAVSHQIKTLEGDLGVTLFHRLARGVTLTDAARELLPEVTNGFAAFERGVGALSQGGLAGKLLVTAPPFFATLWLVPRLGRFLAAFPDIDLEIRAVTHAPDLAKGEADLRIVLGAGVYPGLVTRLLLQDMIFPVCAPTLLNRVPLRSIADLRHHVLLQDVEVDAAEPTITWRRWFRDAGVAELEPLRWVNFNQSLLVTEAAVLGLGVGLTRRVLARHHLRAGRLVRPFKTELPSDYALYTVTTEAGAEHPRQRAFLNWLADEVRRDEAVDSA